MIVADTGLDHPERARPRRARPPTPDAAGVGRRRHRGRVEPGCGRCWPVPTPSSRPPTASPTPITCRTCCSTRCGAVFSRTATTCRVPDFVEFVHVRNRDVSRSGARPGCGRSDRRSTSPTLRDAAARDRRCRSDPPRAGVPAAHVLAADTATRAVRGTGSRSRSATTTATSCCRTRATGATSSRTGRRCSQSYPAYFAHVVAKFVNASTLDGYNPYRISRDGIDWEVPDPDDPWSHIGYWGDHQIVYLLRLLEAWEQHEPGGDSAAGSTGRCSSTPTCRTRSPTTTRWSSTRGTRSPSTTQRADAIAEREQQIGSDGRLVVDADGALVRVGSAREAARAGAGQAHQLRARTAGSGSTPSGPSGTTPTTRWPAPGLSMVTLYHLRRYLAVRRRDRSTDRRRHGRDHRIGRRLVRRICCRSFEQIAGDRASIDDRARRSIVDALGAAGVRAPRDRIGRGVDPATRRRAGRRRAASVRAGGRAARSDRSDGARRDDGLYHSYNRVSFPDADTAHGRPPRSDARGPGRRAVVGSARSAGLARSDRCAVRLRHVPSRSGHVHAVSRRRAAVVPRTQHRFRRRPSTRIRELLDRSTIRCEPDLRDRRRRSAAVPARRRQRRRARRAARPTTLAESRSRHDRRDSTRRCSTTLVHRTLGQHVRLRGHRFGLLAHGRQAAARRAGGLLVGDRQRGTRRRRRTAGRCLPPDPGRSRLPKATRRVRCDPDRLLLAHARLTPAPSSRA